MITSVCRLPSWLGIPAVGMVQTGHRLERGSRHFSAAIATLHVHHSVFLSLLTHPPLATEGGISVCIMGTHCRGLLCPPTLIQHLMQHSADPGRRVPM